MNIQNNVRIQQTTAICSLTTTPIHAETDQEAEFVFLTTAAVHEGPSHQQQYICNAPPAITTAATNNNNNKFLEPMLSIPSLLKLFPGTITQFIILLGK